MSADVAIIIIIIIVVFLDLPVLYEKCVQDSKSSQGDNVACVVMKCVVFYSQVWFYSMAKSVLVYLTLFYLTSYTAFYCMFPWSQMEAFCSMCTYFQIIICSLGYILMVIFDIAV